MLLNADNVEVSNNAFTIQHRKKKLKLVDDNYEQRNNNTKVKKFH